MAYTGYTVKHLHVEIAGERLGTLFVADADSATRLTQWFAGERTRTPDKFTKGVLTQKGVEIAGAADDEERLECLEHFGIDVSDVPEGEDLSKVSFKIEDFRYDTFDVFVQRRQAGRLNRMIEKKQQMTVSELKAELSKLSPEDQIEAMKRLAGLR